MRKVYMSFLGTGEYSETEYEYQGKIAGKTKFVQTAEFELLGKHRPETAFILVTASSKEKHFTVLKDELERFGVSPKAVEVTEDMSPEGQWSWLETILELVGEGDRLTIDFTHGYRSLPIIFSTAIHFLQKTRGVVLEHVFYGAFEQNRFSPPIVDMRRFYDINIWTDAVTRLTEDADAAGIAAASATTNRQFAELENDTFANACTDVTRRIKNVDINNVADSAHKLLQELAKMKENSSPGTGMLLDLVQKKFAPLATPCTSNPDRTGYDLAYFQVQLQLARLLLDHGLFMQAFTVMREWLSSLVMLYFESREKMNAKKRRRRSKHYGGIFFNMLQYQEKDWKFDGKEKERDRIIPFYNELKEQGALDELIGGNKTVAEKLSKYRNGFDHAWLGKAGMENDFEQQGREIFDKLVRCLKKMQQLQQDNGCQYLRQFSSVEQNYSTTE